MAYKPKAGRTNTRWTDEDRTRLRTLHAQGETSWDIARLMDRSHGAITQQLYLMKRRDAAEGYVHVAGDITEIMPNLNTPVRATVIDERLKKFDLYVKGRPSLWQRVGRWFRK